MIAAMILAGVMSAQQLEVRPTASPVKIDAQLDEPAWREATPIPIPYEWFPGDDTPAPVATEVLVSFDARNLYVAFRAHDPRPSQIRARYSERDAAGDDDVVGFYVDPFNDDRRAYQFAVNALGVQIDAIYSDVEASKDFSWNAIWESAGRVTDDGFIVEIAIPMQQLRTPSTAGLQTWGFMAMRDYPRDVKHRLRSTHTDQNRNCVVCQFDDLHGVELRRSGRNVEVTPTVTATDDDAFDAGVSARWAVTPGTSLQATINPDFSQVEADAALLDVNTRFALFYPEKRPFFTEGADVFETRLPLVFTRNIAEPEGGLKLTGKSGPSSYGFLYASDEITSVLVPGDQDDAFVTIDGASTDAMGRYRREVGKNVSLGGLFTLRRGDGYSNGVVSTDSYLRVTERDSLRVQLAASRTDYPASLVDELRDDLPQPSDSFSGHAARATWSHNDRNWSAGANYMELSPGFRADSGFLSQVGIRTLSASADRRIRGGENRWFRNLYVGGGADATQQFDGGWREWGADVNLSYQGPRQSEIRVNLAPNQEYFKGTTYHNFRYGASASMAATRDVSLGLSVRSGETIDFSGSRAAEFVTISPEAAVNIGAHVSGEFAYDYQRLWTTDGERIYAVHLPQARMLYHFNGRAFVRTILQYRVLQSSGEEQRLLTQLLFSYRLNAQTVFLAGYSDNYEGERTLARQGHAVFVKVGYAWLF
jgi:hypothetical protein